MLEQMRRQGASVFIYLIFGLLIVIFVINFAPSGNRGSGGCTTSGNTVVSVDGVDANNSSFLVAYSSPTNRATGRQKTYLALEYVTYQELLAQAAEKRGIRTTGDLIDDQIIQRKRGYFYIGGQRLDASSQFFDEGGNFSIGRWKQWIRSLNIQSPGTYREEQARGLQAAMMSELINGSVRVSRDEALQDYLFQQNTVTYDVLAFDPAVYRRALKITDADVQRYIAEHGPAVEARYKADTALYKGVKPEIAVREIFIPKTVGEPKPAEPAKPGEPAKPAAKPFGLPIEAAKAKLEAVRAQIAAGKLKFEDAEKQLAADSSEDAPAQNGDRGWKKVDDAQLGEKQLDAAVKPLKAGELTPVIVADRGVFLAIVTARREGDLTYDQVKAEIARDQAKEGWAREAAKRAALAALASAQASGKTLDSQYEREQVQSPSPNGMDLDSLPPELRQQIEEMQRKGAPAGGESGALETHETDVPVGWYADADGSSGSAGTATPAPAAGSAAAPAPAAGSAAAPAAGSGAGSAAAAPAAPVVPAADAPIEATKEVLPALNEVKAMVSRLGPVPRNNRLPGVGDSKAAIVELFDELTPGKLAKRVYLGENGRYVVVQLVSKAAPKVEDFDKTASEAMARMQEERSRAAVFEWLLDRCETLNKAKKIRPAPDRIRETDDKGNPAPTIYKPCMYLSVINK